MLAFPARCPPLRRVRVELPETTRPVRLVTFRRPSASPVAKLFVECAREFAGALARGDPC